MTTAERKDPYHAFNFKVEIDGIISGGFTEVSGLSIETEIETRKEGGVNDREHHFLKGSKYANLVLKHGLSDQDAIWKWYNDVVHGKIKRRDCTIYLNDHLGNALRTWHFLEAIPIKWEGPGFNASSSTVATEALTLAHRGMQ